MINYLPTAGKTGKMSTRLLISKTKCMLYAGKKTGKDEYYGIDSAVSFWIWEWKANCFEREEDIN